MKFQILLILATLLLLTSVVYAIDSTQYLNDLNGLKNSMNRGLNNLPGSIRFILGSEDMNVHYTMNGSVTDLHLVLDSGNVAVLETGNGQDPDLDVYLSEADVNDIANAQDRRAEAKRKLDSGEIRVETHGFLTSIKLSLVRSFL